MGGSMQIAKGVGNFNILIKGQKVFLEKANWK